MRLMTFPVSSAGGSASIFSPAAFRFTSFRRWPRQLILILESFWIEMSSFRFQNMLGKFEHFLRHARVGHLCENVLFVAHLVIVAQRRAQNPLAERLQGDDVLAVCHDDAGKADAFLVVHGIPNDDEGFAGR